MREMDNGDTNSFMDDFFSRHYMRIRRMVGHFCGNNGTIADGDDADDIVQQVCEKVLLLGPEGFSSVENEGAYLFRMVRNCYIDHFNRRKRRMADTVDIFTGNLVDLLEDTRSAGKYDPVDISELIAAINEIIAGLSSSKRGIAIMYFFEDCTETAIARSLGRAQSTVAGHVADIRRRLREELKKRFQVELQQYLTDR